MSRKLLIYAGIIIGGIGTIGSILGLAGGDKAAKPATLVVWMAVLAVSLYYLRKDQKS